MSLPNNYFQVVIFSNKSSTCYFVQMFLKENNIDCVGFSQREHYIQRRKNLDQFLTGEVNTAFCCCTILTYEISGEGYLINRLDVPRPWHTWCGYYQPSPISTKCISGVSIITKKYSLLGIFFNRGVYYSLNKSLLDIFSIEHSWVPIIPWK